MRRVIVDYKKLTPEVLNLLTTTYPDGYGDDDIIIFDNHRNERIEAIEVKTEAAIYLVKIGTKLQYTMVNFDANSEIEINTDGHVVVNTDLEEEEEEEE